VLNEKTAQIAAYSINSGTLTTVSGSPYALAAEPYSMAITPNGDFLYVGTAAGIYVYAVDSSSGALTLANNGAVISNDLATTMQVDSTNSWLIEAGTVTGQLDAISLDTGTGLPASKTEEAFNLPGTTVGQIAISPDNDHVFVTDGASGTIVIDFTAGNTDPFAATGTKLGVKNTGGSAVSVAVDPSNRLFYIGETLGNTAANSGGLRVFDYSTLTEISSPYSSGGLSPAAILPMSSGSTLYVANGTGPSSAGVIAEFAINTSGSSYSLTAGPTASSGYEPTSMTVDNTGSYLLAVDFDGNPDLEGYTFDTTTAGELDSVVSAATGTDPVGAISVVAAP
jgi:6-phosphogluconolactonase